MPSQKHREKTERNTNIKRMAERGLTQLQIAMRNRITQSRVHQIIHGTVKRHKPRLNKCG